MLNESTIDSALCAAAMLSGRDCDDIGPAGARERRLAPLRTPNDLGPNARQDIAAALTTLLADVFALYLKTKNFHWHVSGQNFRDYHLMLDEQAAQLLGMTDALAERVRK